MGGEPHGCGEEADGAPPAAVRAGSGRSLNATRSCQTLLAGAIDYAGLFPPASLSMYDAVAEYARHRVATDRWALGRFVVPLARWTELSGAVTGRFESDRPWPVSLLAAPGDAARVQGLMADEMRFVVQSVECKASGVDDAREAGKIAAAGVEVFVEPVVLDDFGSMISELAHSGVAAKIRTGGVTTDAFPTPTQVLVFLRLCRQGGLRFKATAGLHHAVRGEYRLTYDPSPPTGDMFGFLNVAVAAAFLWHGREDEFVLRVLEERRKDVFEFTDRELRWRDERLSVEELADARAGFFAGFGSCSFREPMSEIGLEAVSRS
jgi:hypothetical protein